jgi:hypothetical protein
MARALHPFALRGVTPGSVAVTALASGGATAFGLLERWPIWVVGLAAVIPWLPLFAVETRWRSHRHAGLALFYVLVITQVGHVLEHVTQMTQIHVFHLTGVHARGVFGALDTEWVHFLWNTWVLVAVVLLLRSFRANAWLWLTAALAGWHEFEHLVVFSAYLLTGQAGTPGLLGHGGLLAGGLPVSRPDLHFFYNLIETIPLVAGFVWQFTRGGERPDCSKGTLVERRAG